jgi:hypothetical protein
MIFDVNWSTASRSYGPYRKSPYDDTRTAALRAKFVGKIYDARSELGNKIKNSRNDSFIVTVTNYQLRDFESFLKDFNLESYVALRTEKAFNPVHPDAGKNLTLFVLQPPKTNHESHS